MNKSLVIFMLFTMIAFAYVIFAMHKMSKNVSKIEAFSNADAAFPVKSTSANIPTRLNPSDYGKLAEIAPVIKSSSVLPIVATTTPVVTTVPTTTPVVTTVPTTTTSTTIAGPVQPISIVAPIAGTREVISPIAPVAQITQVPQVPQVIDAVQETIIRPSPALFAQPTVGSVHTQPNPALPIADDEERRFWIGNVLYNLLPNNGMAKFMNEVKSLADKYRYDSFGTIVQNMRDFVAQKLSRDERVFYDLAKYVTEMKNKQQDNRGRFGVYRPPWENGTPWSGYMPLDSPLAGGYYPDHVPNTWRGNGFMFPADHVEMFQQPSADNASQPPQEAPTPTPTPMSYVKQYTMHDKWANGGGGGGFS